MTASGTGAVDFAYAISQTQAATNAINAQSPELKSAILKLILDLAEDPHAHPMWKFEFKGATVFFPPTPVVEISYTLDEQRKVLNVVDVAVPLRRRRLCFLSYSHADKKHVDFVLEYLATLDQAGIIKLWTDCEILAGDRWQVNIDDALQSAGAAVLMVTQGFLRSAFIQDVEVPALLDRAAQFGTKVFWIPVEPSTVFKTHPHLTALQSPLPNPSKSLWERTPVAVRKRACVDIIDNIVRTLSA
jgi:hypothetical protein